jgi:hypothetical protein
MVWLSFSLALDVFGSEAVIAINFSIFAIVSKRLIEEFRNHKRSSLGHPRVVLWL